MIKFINEVEPTDDYPCSRLEVTLEDPEGLRGVVTEFVHFLLATGFHPDSIRECLEHKAGEMQ